MGAREAPTRPPLAEGAPLELLGKVTGRECPRAFAAGRPNSRQPVRTEAGAEGGLRRLIASAAEETPAGALRSAEDRGTYVHGKR